MRVSIIFILLIFFSCNFEKKEKKKLDIEIILGRQDTILKDKIYKGSLEYISYFDSINPSLINKKFTFMYISSVQKKFENLEDFETVDYKGIIIDSSKVNFNFNFKESGEKKLNFIIKDVVAFRGQGDSIRILENTINFDKVFLVKKDDTLNELKKELFEVKFVKSYN